ncbi:MAG: methyltransferase domain-containing protein [Burkholderiales bacterium]
MPIDDLKRSALALHQAGKLDEAEAAYRAALDLAPDDPDCLHMLGVLAYQRGRFAEALERIDRARATKPPNLAAIDFNRAMVVSGILGRCASAPESPAVAGVAHPRCTRVACAVPGNDATLRFTGERFVPELNGAIWAEHWHRYCAVAPLAAGRRVLDAACGEGYGSDYLATFARAVTGVDVSAGAVQHARERYRRANLEFVAASVAALPMADASFDLVVSFETIEHLAQQAEMLAEFRRVLAPDGVLVLSSPNKPVYSANGAFRNEYHVKELTREELADLLRRDFPRQRWYRQRPFARSTMWRDDAAAARFIDLPATYFVVVCGGSDADVPALADCSVLARNEASTLFLEAEIA